MDISLEGESLRYYDRLASTAYTHEQMTEIIVPDAMPDIGSVLTADGAAYLRGKEAQNGTLTISGSCEGTVLYIPEAGGTPRSLSLQTPFEAVCDCPGAEETDRIVVSLSLCGMEARILNSRKLLVRMEVCVTASVWKPRQLRYLTRCQPETGLELKRTRYEVKPVTDVTEKTFGTESTLALPGGKPPMAALMSVRAQLKQEEAAVVGSKLILRGSVRAVALYETTDGQLESAELWTPYSVILELAGGEENREFETVAALTGCHAEPAEGGISLELGAVAQAVIRSQAVVDCLSDAYGLDRPLTPAYETVRLPVNGRGSETADTVRLTIDSPKSLRSVTDAAVYCGKPRLEAGQVKATVTAKLLCATEDGRLAALSGRGEAVRPAATAGSSPAGSGAAAAYTVELGEPFAAVTATGVELRVPAVFRGSLEETVEAEFLTQAVWSEEEAAEAADAPSVTLLRAAEGDSVWSLGKRAGLPCALIRQLNGLEEAAEPAAGQLILLARGR